MGRNNATCCIPCPQHPHRSIQELGVFVPKQNNSACVRTPTPATCLCGCCQPRLGHPNRALDSFLLPPSPSPVQSIPTLRFSLGCSHLLAVPVPPSTAHPAGPRCLSGACQGPFFFLDILWLGSHDLRETSTTKEKKTMHTRNPPRHFPALGLVTSCCPWQKEFTQRISESLPFVDMFPPSSRVSALSRAFASAKPDLLPSTLHSSPWPSLGPPSDFHWNFASS